jgi:hypothetical protein
MVLSAALGRSRSGQGGHVCRSSTRPCPPYSREEVSPPIRTTPICDLTLLAELQPTTSVEQVIVLGAGERAAGALEYETLLAEADGGELRVCGGGRGRAGVAL